MDFYEGEGYIYLLDMQSPPVDYFVFNVGIKGNGRPMKMDNTRSPKLADYMKNGEWSPTGYAVFSLFNNNFSGPLVNRKFIYSHYKSSYGPNELEQSRVIVSKEVDLIIRLIVPCMAGV